MERGEVCLEQEVERRWESGMAPEEIAREMGVDAGWIAVLISTWSGGDASGEESARRRESG